MVWLNISVGPPVGHVEKRMRGQGQGGNSQGGQEGIAVIQKRGDGS